MKIVALFGGAFDPPHLGHTEIIQYLLEDTKIEKIIIAPTGNREDKEYQSPESLRKEMILLWMQELGNNPKCILDFDIFEAKVGEGTWEHDTYFREKYSADKVIHIFGSDTVDTMSSWKPEGERVARELQKITFDRIGFTPDYSHIDNYTLIPKSIPEVSSTDIRNGNNTLLTPEIAKFIQSHHLYTHK